MSSQFRTAVESGDQTAIEALLADDVRFTSPVTFKPYDGKAITAASRCGATRPAGSGAALAAWPWNRPLTGAKVQGRGERPFFDCELLTRPAPASAAHG